MIDRDSQSSRREFVGKVGRIASAASLSALAPLSTSERGEEPETAAAEEWDLSWVKRLAGGTDKAVFDWPSLGDPADPIMLELAERYMQNCEAAYRPKTYTLRIILNIRTAAVPAALTDALWERYGIGAEYNVKDPSTGQPATRNPFWHRAPDLAPGIPAPALPDFVDRGHTILVCNFALTNMSKRIAEKRGLVAGDVHKELRAGLVPGSYAVPSGIFGLAKAQNSGCALVRL